MLLWLVVAMDKDIGSSTAWVEEPISVLGLCLPSEALVHVVVLRVALVVLQIGQRGRLNTDVECPALV